MERNEFVGEARSIRELREALAQVAPTTATVLIRGETGVGKELIAHAVHEQSPRAGRPFVVVDCAVLHDNLLQSELFGHERGAYTGAFTAKPGLFETAHRGTLFLDEIAELPPALQVKLLRVLESGTFRRLGGVSDIHVDVRLVAATNRLLEKMIEDGRFRSDLFYRLNVFPLDVPPLREHPEDLPLLARHVLDRVGSAAAIDAGALDRLAGYRWPGNVRELAHVLERALILSGGGTIQDRHLPIAVRQEATPPPRETSDAESLRGMEIEHIERVLAHHNGNRQKTAAALGIGERTLYRRLREGRGQGAETPEEQVCEES